MNGTAFVTGTADYAVTTSGELFSKKTGRWLPIKACPLESGYMRVVISQHGIRRSVSVHRLVLDAFVGPCPDGMQCCHNDGNPSNNRLENLRWDTPKSNQQDRRRHGRNPKGNRNARAVLNDGQVRDIREKYKHGVTALRLAREYGVSEGAVHHIIRRSTWKHVA